MIGIMNRVHGFDFLELDFTFILNLMCNFDSSGGYGLAALCYSIIPRQATPK